MEGQHNKRFVPLLLGRTSLLMGMVTEFPIPNMVPEFLHKQAKSMPHASSCLMVVANHSFAGTWTVVFSLNIGHHLFFMIRIYEGHSNNKVFKSDQEKKCTHRNSCFVKHDKFFYGLFYITRLGYTKSTTYVYVFL